MLIYVADLDWLTFSQVYRHQHGLHIPHTTYIGTIQPQHAHRFPLATTLLLPSQFLPIPPGAHGTQPHPKSRQHRSNPAITQTQHPAQGGELSQTLALISPVHSRWVVAKSAVTAATPIAMYLYIVDMTVTHWLTYLSPALKGLSWAIGTLLWASFAFELDIWQLQDDNRHGRLRVMAVGELPSY
jgi:hypothetical protein